MQEGTPESGGSEVCINLHSKKQGHMLADIHSVSSRRGRFRRGGECGFTAGETVGIIMSIMRDGLGSGNILTAIRRSRTLRDRAGQKENDGFE